MKDVRMAVRALLLADPAISAAVGGMRIFTGILPQGITSPSLVQNLITEDALYVMQGGDDGLLHARIQIAAWALTQDLAVNLSNLAFDRMSGFSGVVAFGSSSPQETMALLGVFYDQGRDDYDPVTLMFVRRRDFWVWYVGR